jgi:hypothetical protein
MPQRVLDLLYLAHTTPINHNDMLLPKIVHDKELPLGRRPCNKSRSQRNLSPPDIHPRERNAIITNKDIVGANNELPFCGGGPSKLVFIFVSHSNRIQ